MFVYQISRYGLRDCMLVSTVQSFWGIEPLERFKASLESVRSALGWVRRCFECEGIEDASLEAEVLVRYILALDRADLFREMERILSVMEIEELETLTIRRCDREPLPYILGCWEFYGLTFIVNPHVMIPRQATEQIVDEAIIWAKNQKHQRKTVRVADVGTGSGCIAVSLARLLPEVEIVAIDISREAIAVAIENITRHGVDDRVWCLQANLLESLSGGIDLIVANLPYIPDHAILEVQPEIKDCEPLLALRGGTDGLHLVRLMLRQVANCLEPDGAVIMEMDSAQCASMKELWAQECPGQSLRIIQDLAGVDRILMAQSGTG